MGTQLQLASVISILTLVAGAARAEVDASKLPAPANHAIDFVTEIKPIFEQSCFRCHGPERPKSGFRLDDRESAIKGGHNGPDIISGDSAKSPLIHYVARLDPDMTMPPEGKGEPLTTEQISLLRAWIDQGASWGDEATVTSSMSLMPAFAYVTVQGNKSKFREHQWVEEGGRGGLESFEIFQRYSPDTKLTITGHAMENDYRADSLLEKTDVGFARVGFEQFRKYDSDTGGYAPTLNPHLFSLDRDLHLDEGKAWIDLGLTLPNWPRFVLGYEYQYRTGERATLAWGAVGTISRDTPGTDAKAIYPAIKNIDEHTHILKFDAEYERDSWRIEDSFRGEWTESRTSRENVNSLVLGTPNTFVYDSVNEGWKSFQGANILRVEHEFRDWLHGSAGYLYSHLSADADFSLSTFDPTGAPIVPPVIQNIEWRSQRITLERESHVANANALLGPWEGTTLNLGVQTEWTRQNGTAEGFYDTFATPPFSFLTKHEAVNFLSDIDKAIVDETASLRFIQLPFTTVFGEARLQQQCIGHFEHADFEHEFDRDTDARNNTLDLRAGFDTSPRTWIKFGAHYRYLDKNMSFDDGFADFPIDPIDGYPTFITELNQRTHEVEAHLTLKPTRWVTTTLTYRLEATDYQTTTESLTQDTPGDVSAGGQVSAGDYDAQVFSLNATVTPWSRMYWYTTISYQDINSTSLHAHSDAVVPYRGHTWSVLCHGKYALNEKTDLTAGYSFSTANFGQDNPIGLPLGIDYELHGLQAGVIWHPSKDLTFKFQYGFYDYSEPSAGGFNDYTAHAVLAAVTLRLP